MRVDGKVVNLFFQRFVYSGRDRNGRDSNGRNLHGRGRDIFRVFSRGRCFAAVAEMRTDPVCKVVVKRTGVRFLVRMTLLGQVLDYDVTLHFQFACQFVDSNLPHA